MKLCMVFDTETTGRTDFKAAYDALHQPNLVQLGYKVYEVTTRQVVFEIGHLVDSTRIPGWSGIEAGAQAVHGITEDILRMYGIEPEKALRGFLNWTQKCDLFVAHNKSFDVLIMQTALKRNEFSPDWLEGKSTYCTMMTSTSICQIPSPTGRGYKWPKLSEAYPYFTGKELSGAHDALVDVNGCAEIFWHHVDRGLFNVNNI